MRHFTNNRMATRLFYVTLVLWLLFPTYAQATPKLHRLAVSDIAGYYVTNDKNTSNQALSLTFLNKTSKGNEIEQGNFTGRYGEFPIVGQGILTGGTDDGRIADNMIEFDFMYMEPQDDTVLMHSTSLMSKGRVIGLLINEAGFTADGTKNVPVRYRRVSYTQFITFQQTHRG